MIITHTLIIVLDEPNNPRKKKGSNSTFRRKVKTEDAQRLPLDLEPDSPKLRAIKHVERRKRGFRRAAMILMAMSLVALGHAALKETLFQNPRFTLREIKVVSQGMLTESQIQAACGTATGVNLLSVNLHDVRERVMQMPAIRSATVQRDFEVKLTITAQQRQPIAWVKCEKQGWIPKHPLQGLLVDEEGIAIPAEVMLSDFEDLPVIDDSTVEQITPGRPISSTRFLACMTLLKELQKRNPQGGDRLVSLRVPNTFAIEASFASAAKVTFSYDDLPPQLQRYDRFAAEARQKHWSIETLNLVAEHNVPVTFRIAQASALPLAIPVAQLADAAPATHSSINRAARNSTTAGKSTHKSPAH